MMQLNVKKSLVLSVIALFFCVFSVFSVVTEKVEGGDKVGLGDKIFLKIKKSHPRLFIDGDFFTTLKVKLKTDTRRAGWYDEVKGKADKLLKVKPLVYRIPDGKRLLSVSRGVVDRVYNLSIAFKVSGDVKYRKRLYEELQSAGKFKDWNPSHFLDTAEMTHGFAIAYDWLYEDWSSSERAFIRGAIVKHGLKPGVNCYERKKSYGWWVRSEHNWNQVCNAGMLMGALAIGDEDEAIAKVIIKGGMKSIPISMKQFGPDGGYGEGPGYWSYGVSYATMFVGALKSATGSDWSLMKSPGFSETALFPMYMTSPAGRAFNFADSSAGRPTTWPAMWLGDYFDQPAARWFAAARVRYPNKALVWFRDGGKSPGELGLSLGRAWKVSEACSMRGSWTDAKTGFVAFKAGAPYINHAQADLGSFVYEVNGERFAEDLGGDNYNLPGYFDRKKRRWYFYRNRAEGHNTLVINPGSGPDQVVSAKTKIERFVVGGVKGGKQFGIADLTKAYKPHVKSLKRGVMLLGGKSLLVQDEISVDGDRGARVFWFMHTAAKGKVSDDGRSVMLTRGGVEVEAVILSPVDGKFTIESAAPFASSPTVKGQKVNKGIVKLSMALQVKGSERIVVLLRPVMPEKQKKLPAVVPLAKW